MCVYVYEGVWKQRGVEVIYFALKKKQTKSFYD